MQPVQGQPIGGAGIVALIAVYFYAAAFQLGWGECRRDTGLCTELMHVIGPVCWIYVAVSLLMGRQAV